jgi:hypothetical protein
MDSESPSKGLQSGYICPFKEICLHNTIDPSADGEFIFIKLKEALLLKPWLNYSIVIDALIEKQDCNYCLG